MRITKSCAVLAALCLLLTGCSNGSHEPEPPAAHRITVQTSETTTTTLPETTLTETTSIASSGKTILSTSQTDTSSGTTIRSSASADTAPTQGSTDVPPVTSRSSSHTSTASRTTTSRTTSSSSSTLNSETTTVSTQKTTVSSTTPEPVEPKTIQERLAAMSLQEKASQMMMGSASSEADAKAAAQNGVGAICLFAGAFSGKTADEVREMTATLQAAAKTPLLLSVDEEGGTVNRVSLNWRLRGTPFRSPYAIFQESGMEAVLSDAQDKASLLLSLGINVNLGPVCDVPLSSSNYIYNRSFGLDAALTSEYISAVIPTVSAAHLGSVLKHFPGYGGSVDTHQYVAYDDRSYEEFASRDLLPFKAGIDAGADAVMVSHNIVLCMDADAPASLSPEVHRVLREELGFTGVIMTDDLGMGAITQYSGGQDPAVAAVLAGNDIVTYANYSTSVPAIVSAVESGIIDEAQIDASVLRILAWKESLGLL